MARQRRRSQAEVLARAGQLRDELRAALAKLPQDEGDPAVVDAVWRGEALGTLLWALQLAELPPYDRPFDPDLVLAVDLGAAALRPEAEIELEREAARLWHWRARTAELEAAGRIELPERYATLDQLVAATAMRGYEQGVLPQPMRGDFRAYEKVYRHLSAPEYAEARSIAVERHHALNYLAEDDTAWDDVSLDT